MADKRGGEDRMPFFEKPHCVKKITGWFVLSVAFIGAMIFLSNLLLPNGFKSLVGPIALFSFALVWVLVQKYGYILFRSDDLIYSNKAINEHKKDLIKKEKLQKILNE